MKRFLSSLLLAFVACLGTWAQSNEEQPLLTIGCVSDVHCMNSMITPESGNIDDIRVRASLTRVLERMKAEDQPDVLVFGGDSESDKSLDEINSKMTRWVLADAMRKVFVDGKNPNVLWLTGNHDYEVANFDNVPKPYNAGNFYDFPMKEDIGILSDDDLFYEMADNGALGQEKLLAAYHYVINGFDFVVLNCGKYFFKSAWDYTFSVESCTWVKNKLDEIYASDPNKTVFFLCHVPFQDSNSINSGKGMNTTQGYPILKAALAAHPNLIMLYGHDHGKDTAYIHEKTSQRVTLYDTNGNVIATTDETHVEAGGDAGTGTTPAPTPVRTAIPNVNIKSKSGKYFGISSTTNDVGVLDDPYAFDLRPVSGYDNAYGIWLKGSTTNPINSGSYGYLSKGSNADNERLFYFYEATEADGTITAHLVDNPQPGTDYILGVANINDAPHGFYLVYCSLASGKNNRFDVVPINYSAINGRTVALIPENLEITTAYSSSNGPISLDKIVWQIESNGAEPEPTPEPGAGVTTGTFYVTNGGQHLIKDSNNLNLGATPTEHALEAGTAAGTFKLKTSSSNYLHIGSSGRWSDGTATPLLLFDTDGNRAYSVVSGQSYYITAPYNGAYYAMKAEVYSPGSGQRMATATVTLNGDQTSMTSTPGEAFAWTFTDPTTVTPEPSDGTPSFFSSFMGSLRYYHNSIDTGDPADMPTVVQGLIVKVYSDRVELQMKNYNQTGTLAGQTVVEVPASYISYRAVTHSTNVEYTKGEATPKPVPPTIEAPEFPVEGVKYAIKNLDSGLYLNVVESDKLGTVLNNYPQALTFTWQSTGGFYIKNEAGQYVGGHSNSWNMSSSTPEKWTVEVTEDGKYSFKCTTAGKGQCIGFDELAIGSAAYRDKYPATEHGYFAIIPFDEAEVAPGPEIVPALPIATGVYEIQNAPSLENRGYLVDYTGFEASPSLAECHYSGCEGKHPADRNSETTSSYWYVYNKDGQYYIISLSALQDDDVPRFIKPAGEFNGVSAYTYAPAAIVLKEGSSYNVGDKIYKYLLISAAETPNFVLSGACGTRSEEGAVRADTNTSDGGAPWKFIPAEIELTATQQAIIQRAVALTEGTATVGSVVLVVDKATKGKAKVAEVEAVSGIVLGTK